MMRIKVEPTAASVRTTCYTHALAHLSLAARKPRALSDSLAAPSSHVILLGAAGADLRNWTVRASDFFSGA